MSVTIGKAIKIIREAKAKTLCALATEAKVSIPYLSLVEANKRNPSLEVIKRLSEALEIPADTLLLIGSGAGTSLVSSNNLTSRLMDILGQIENLEKRIKDAIKKQGY